MNACNIKFKINNFDLVEIRDIMEFYPEDYEYAIKQEFGEKSDTILRVINYKKQNSSDDISLSLEDFSTENLDKIKESNIPINANPELAYDHGKDPIGYLYKGNASRYSRTMFAFKNKMVECCIVDENGNAINPEYIVDGVSTINRKIWEYKKQLIRDIAKVCNCETIDGDINDIDAYVIIHKALDAFRSKYNSGTFDMNSELNLKALDAYAILSHFDEMLKTSTDFIKIKSGFNSREGINKYEYVGPKTDISLQSYNDDNDKANEISSNTSSLAIILLEYFPEINVHGEKISGTKITQPGFNQVMSSFKEWINSAPWYEILGVAREDTIKRSDKVDILNKLYKCDIETFKTLFGRFCKLAESSSSHVNIERFSANKLRGIKKILLSDHDSFNLSDDIRTMMIALANKTEINVAQSSSRYRGNIQNKVMQDNFKDKQFYVIRGAINASARKFAANPKLFETICSVFGIKCGEDGDGEPTVSLFNDSIVISRKSTTGKNWSYAIEHKKKVSEANIKNLIETVLEIAIPDDYVSILTEMRGTNTDQAPLINMFSVALGETILAANAKKDNGNDKYNIWSDRYDGEENSELKAEVDLDYYRDGMAQMQNFLGLANGVSVSATIRDSFGNNVAPYQLACLERQLSKTIAHELAYEPNTDITGYINPYFNNLLVDRFVNHREKYRAIGDPRIRKDVNIDGRRKLAKDLTESEVAYTGIVVDFLSSLRNVQGRENYICFQSTTHADKGVHYVIPYSRYLQLDDNSENTLENCIRKIINTNDQERKYYANVFINSIKNRRSQYYKGLLNNLVLDYFNAFRNSDKNTKFKGKYIFEIKALSNEEKISYIEDVLDNMDLKTISAEFYANRIKFTPEFHYTKDSDGNIVFNEVFKNNVILYCDNSDKYNLAVKARLREQQRLFLKDLDDCGFEINSSVDKETVKYIRTECGKSWVDNYSGKVLLYKGDLDGDFEINPMLEAYFYSDVLLSNEYNKIMLGETFFHPNKYKPSKENGDFVLDDNGNTIIDYGAFKSTDIVFASPTLGKTYAITSGHNEFIDWDVEFNRKRDEWFESHREEEDYDSFKKRIMIDPGSNSDYKQFVRNEWNRVKIKAKIEGKALLASPKMLLDWFGKDFTRIITMDTEEFVRRDLQRGGNDEVITREWKKNIDSVIKKHSNIPTIYVGEGQYLNDIIKKGKKAYTEKYFQHAEAARLSASYKRTVILGATTHLLTPSKEGISKDGINVAVIDDMNAVVFNMLGVQNSKLDALDGCGLSSPCQAMLENNSLPGAQVGMDKKTIFQDIDPKTGAPSLLKWAIYALTNNRRKMSYGSKVSADILFKKMHSISMRDKAIRINISNFYKPNSGNIANDESVKTYNEFIYFKNPKTGKHYRIDSIEKTGIYKVKRIISEVDLTGKVIGGQISEDIQYDTLYEIDQIFGGAWNEKLHDGRLVGDNSNNTIITYMMASNEKLKDCMVGYLVNKSAIKNGASNINSNALYNRNNKDNLKYYKHSILFGGVQMDADHELAESEVTEMSQMISALIQNGYYVDEVNEIYTNIGSVVVNALSKWSTLINAKDKLKIQRKLGESLIKSFEVGSKDTIGLAQAYLMKAARELKYSGVDIKIPFSDPTIFGAFIADVASGLNKSGIKRKYAGIATVLNPSRGMIQLFHYGKSPCFYDKMIERVKESHPEIDIELIDDYIWHDDPVEMKHGVDGEEVYIKLSNGETVVNPFIEEVKDSHLLEMYDTIYIYNNGEFKELVLDSYDDYDYARNLVDSGIIFKHNLRPKDLRPAETTFYLKNNIGQSSKFSIYDLDSVRATHYIRQFKNKNGEINLTELKKSSPEKYNILLKYLSQEFHKKIISNNSNGIQIILDKNEVNDLLSLIKRQVNLDLKHIDEDSDIGFNNAFSKAGFINGDKIVATNVRTRLAECVMGYKNAKDLGVDPDVSFADIREKGASYFANIINETYDTSKNVIDKDIYDTILIDSKGDKLFVRIREFHDDSDSYKKGFVKDSRFDSRGGSIYFNDKELCSDGGKEFYVNQGVETDTKLVVVDNLDEVNDIIKNSNYTNTKHNYTDKNYIALLMNRYSRYVDENGKAIEDFSIGYDDTRTYGINANLKISEGENVYDILSDSKNGWLSLDLARMQEANIANKIKHISEDRYNAFEMQTKLIGARIPTQSMQSFMGMDVVENCGSTINEGYEPAQETWLQGSDLDIDKSYKMMFGITNGTISTFSRLHRDDCPVQEQLKLPKPQGREFSRSIFEKESFKFTKQNVDDILIHKNFDSFAKALRSGFTDIYFEHDVFDFEAKKIIRMLNMHESSKLSNYQKEDALKNSIVYNIINLVGKARNQVALHVPITMDEFQELASKSSLSSKEKAMTSDNPMTKFIMQVVNMVGKDVIGITAVGLKVYYATTTYCSININRIADSILRGDLNSEQNLYDKITFLDPITGDTGCLANLCFDKVFDAIEKSNLSDYYKSSLIYKYKNLQNISDSIDASESLSELLSAATDNAKELILSKINATADFADAWSMLLMTGHNVKDIGNLMMSEIFSLIPKYSKTDVYSDIITSASPKTATGFILGQNQLSGLDTRALGVILGYKDTKHLLNFDNGVNNIVVDNDTLKYINDVFVYKLFFETETGGENAGKLKRDANNRLIPRRESERLITEDELKIFVAKNVEGSEISEKKKAFKQKVKELINNTQDIKKGYLASIIFKNHLISVLIHKLKDYRELHNENFSFDAMVDELMAETQYEYEGDGDPNEINEDAFIEQAIQDQLFEDENYVQAFKETDDKWFSDMDHKDIRKMYRYVDSYLIRKQQRLYNIYKKNPAQYDLDWVNVKNYFDSVIPFTEEQKILGSMLGVNQGLQTNQFAFYSRLKRVENFVWDKYKNSVIYNEETPKFNIIEFIRNKDYRLKWIDYYEKIKSFTNILDVISTVPNFSSMFDSNVIAYELMEMSVLARMNFRIANTITEGGKSLSEDEFNNLFKFNKDSLLLSYLANKSIEVRIPKFDIRGIDKFDFPMLYADKTRSENELSLKVLDSESFTVDSQQNIANFINLMETYVFPYLKHKYKDNKFCRYISTSDDINKLHQQRVNHYKMSLDMMNIDASQITQEQYNAILDDFNKISDERIMHNGNDELGLSIKDLIFLYNTVVYKNGFSTGGFTRIMESVIEQENYLNSENKPLVLDYADFLADLDSGKLNSGDLQNESFVVEVDKDDFFNTGIILARRSDLMARLCIDPKSAKKFGYRVEFENGAISELIKLDEYGNDTDEIYNIKSPNISLFPFYMPSMTMVVKENPKGYKPNVVTDSYSYSSSGVVLESMIENIEERFGISGNNHIKVITREDIRKAYEDSVASRSSENSDYDGLYISSESEMKRMLESNAFIHDGNIYLVADRYNQDIFLHEVLHLAIASFKFSDDQRIVDAYYELQEKVYRFILDPKNGYRERYEALRKTYSKEAGSDFKEEVLVDFLQDVFRKQALKKFNGSQFFENNENLLNEVKQFAISAVNVAMDAKIPDGVDLGSLMFTSLSNIAAIFKSSLNNPDGNPFGINIELSQKLKTIKRKLLDAYSNKGKNYVEYDC